MLVYLWQDNQGDITSAGEAGGPGRHKFYKKRRGELPPVTDAILPPTTFPDPAPLPVQVRAKAPTRKFRPKPPIPPPATAPGHSLVQALDSYFDFSYVPEFSRFELPIKPRLETPVVVEFPVEPLPVLVPVVEPTPTIVSLPAPITEKAKTVTPLHDTVPVTEPQIKPQQLGDDLILWIMAAEGTPEALAFMNT